MLKNYCAKSSELLAMKMKQIQDSETERCVTNLTKIVCDYVLVNLNKLPEQQVSNVKLNL